MTASDRTDLDSVVIFRLGADTFAIPAEVVREVVPIAWLSRPPRMPSLIHGILNLGGAAVPVLKLDAVLGVEGCRFGLDASILIMRGDSPLGLLVEHVEGVRRIADFTLVPLADRHSHNGCLVGALAADGAAIHLVAWGRVLLEEERRRLAEFQAHTQQRLAELVDETS